jgi:hypothetical protein
VNISWNLKLNLKSLQIQSKGLRRNPYVNKSEAKSRWTLLLSVLDLKVDTNSCTVKEVNNKKNILNNAFSFVF